MDSSNGSRRFYTWAMVVVSAMAAATIALQFDDAVAGDPVEYPLIVAALASVATVVLAARSDRCGG